VGYYQHTLAYILFYVTI